MKVFTEDLPEDSELLRVGGDDWNDDGPYCLSVVAVPSGKKVMLKLYDLVWENHVKANELIEWKRTYDDGPLSTGEKVDRFVEETNRDIKTIKETVSRFDEHPPCAIHQSRADDLARLIKLHEKELREQG